MEDDVPQRRRAVDHCLANRVGKIWERSPVAQSPVNSHRINGTDILVRSHNPKVVGLNPPPATMGAERLNLEAPFFLLVAEAFKVTSEAD